ncbi:MAG: T9SS type A sorting domain-containing protein [Flavobacteriaceae bacterium]|nr:T9SS type A sorting domain-containing protein [Flavobacteriaceae bacterium]
MKKQYSKIFTTFLAFGMALTGMSQVTNLGASFQANSVSNNGEEVVGTIGNTHFIWTEADGLQNIGSVTNGFPMAGTASISNDGLKISATVTNPNNNFNEMGYYDVTTQTWTYLGGIGGPIDGSISSAWSISGDGTTAVGLGWIGGNAHGIKWTETDGMVDLGSTVANRSSRANDANNDGSVIVGWQDSTTGFRQAAIWVDGVQSLITNQGGSPVGEAGAVSGDGNWVIGGGNNFEAWRWSEDTGMINIPHPNSDFSFRGSATSINEDGSIIVGFYRPFPGPAIFGEGFIWTEETGRVELNTYVTSLGMDTQGIIFSLPLGMSNDGSSIVGLGRLGNAQVGFMIKLPTAAINDLCDDAIALSCGDSVSGSTSNATNIAGTDSPDVFYSYTGSGVVETVTISLCDPNTNFDTILRVYSSCDLTDEIAVNDDFCGLQSELSFESDGTSTYIIMVEGFDVDEFGDFTLEITCETLSTTDFELNQLNMYPNPTNGLIHINSSVTIETVEIYNTAGQLVMNQKINTSNPTINIAGLQNGIYFAKAISKDASKTIKIVKK